MNDLDLRAALLRDAELVGEPSPHLLDQLAQRRAHQRHQRTAAFASVLGVVVIAAGVPVGTAFMTRSDSAPATDPTPSTSNEAPPTTAAPTTAAPAVVVPPPVVTAPAAESPACPDGAVLDAALPADTARVTYALHQAQPVCSGTWAATGYSRTQVIRAGDTLEGFDDQGRPVQYAADADEEWLDESAGLFRYTDGSWTFLSRDDYCGKVTLPDLIWERACNVD